MKVMFELLLTKRGVPRKRQNLVNVAMNGTFMSFKRGVPVDVPEWVPEVTKAMFPEAKFYAYICQVQDKERS